MKKKWICTMLICAVTALFAGCQEQKDMKKEDTKQKDTEITAKNAEDNLVVTGMYLTFGEENDQYIFADVEQNSLFYAMIPEDQLFDADGDEIDQEDLQAGDVVAMYGNGIVAESYPPQYAGIIKIERTEKGTAEDAKKYDELIAQIYQAPEPYEVPYLSIENEQEMAIVTTSIDHGGYTWSYIDENEEQETITADASHVLEWDYSNNELVCDTENKDLKLMFSRTPKSVTVTRWDRTATMEEEGSGVLVEVDLDGKEAELEDAVSGIYQVVAAWDNGEVIYGFAVR